MTLLSMAGSFFLKDPVLLANTRGYIDGVRSRICRAWPDFPVELTRPPGYAKRIEYIYIYILVWTRAYTCTEQSGAEESGAQRSGTETASSNSNFER